MTPARSLLLAVLLLGAAPAAAQQLLAIPSSGQSLSVAVAPQTLAVGAPHATTPCVHLFDFDGAGWTPSQLLDPASSPFGGGWGNRLALDGTLLLVSTSYAPAGGIPGAVQAFRDGGTSWSAESLLVPADGAYYFGTDVAIDEGRAVVAAIFAMPNQDGAVYAYTSSGASWTQRQKIVPPTSTRIAFGDSVAAGGGRIVVGAPLDGQVAPGAGAAFVYRWNPATLLYDFERKLVAPDGVTDDAFGWMSTSTATASSSLPTARRPRPGAARSTCSTASARVR